MGSDGKKKKILIIGLSVVLLVIVAGGVSYGVIRKNSKSEEKVNNDTTSISYKAIKVICEPTNYKNTCERSLASANTSNPKDLLNVAFQATLTNIGEVVQKSSLLKKASMDPMTSQAMEICKEVLDTSVEDIQSSINKVERSDFDELGSTIADLKTWIGGAITFQETCLDAFENTTGDTGEKMKKLLKMGGELTSNSLAMVSSFTQVLEQLHIPIPISFQVQDDETDVDDVGFPSYVHSTVRRLLASRAHPKPNVIVAKDGTGQFKTINEALQTIPNNNNNPFIIFIKAGIYDEHVHILKSATRVVLIGEGPTKTRITGHKNYVDGVNTFQTATVIVDGDNFIAKDIGFENSAGAIKHQAVALRVTGDFSVFFNCNMDGYQDTLYAHNKRQFYKDCTITGTIDFVFGDAQAIFQNCKFIVRKPLPNQDCMVTAQGRKDRNGPGALILQYCKILATPEFLAAGTTVKAYLGRPWKEYSRTIIMNSLIDGFIAPEGWSPWMGNFALDTLYYVEYQNMGQGAGISQRVRWKGIQNITPQIAKRFRRRRFYEGSDRWIKEAVALNL